MMKYITKILLIVSVAAMGVWMSCNDFEPFDPYKQLEIEQTLIDDYLAQHSLVAETDTAFDLRYIIQREGNGLYPETEDSVNISYTGKLLSNGQVFDENDSITFQLQGLIAGWQILMPYVSEGGKITMFVPSGYAYGHNGWGSIPPDATLIFDVELNVVYEDRTPQEQLEYEQARIDDYIAENELQAQKDPEHDLRYIVINAGTGASPGAKDSINVNYEGRFLSTDKVFAMKDNADLKLDKQIEGWRTLLPYIKEGGQIVMFIPSKYGYGSTDVGNIPANSTLIYTVELNEVKAN